MPNRLSREELVTIQVLSDKGVSASVIARQLHVSEGAVRYQREYFCSYPARVLAARLTSDTPGKVGFTLALKPAHKDYSLRSSPDGRTLELVGKIDGNGRRYRAVIELRPEGGHLTHDDKSLRLEGADAATVLYTIATDYALAPPTYRGADPETITSDIMRRTADRSYEDLRREHVEDYTNLYRRTAFQLQGLTATEQLPTDERWRRYANGDDADLGLKTLAFNLGKYLLISASRPGSLPANLQGVWNRQESRTAVTLSSAYSLCRNDRKQGLLGARIINFMLFFIFLFLFPK